MPIGPNLSQAQTQQQQQQQQQQPGSLFDQLNVTGMDDSMYAAAAGGAGSNGTGGGSGGGGGGPSSFLAASLSSDRVVPLQRENLRLVRSNNALQAHLVAEGERIDEAEKTWAQELRTIKTKYTDLQFLHAQKTRKIANVSVPNQTHILNPRRCREGGRLAIVLCAHVRFALTCCCLFFFCSFVCFQQETKLSELQHRLEQVLSDRQAYVKESVEASSRLEVGPIRAAASFRPQDPHLLPTNSEVDLMKQHENKLAELAANLALHEARQTQWETERTTLLAKVSTRDAEVKRLSEVLESERNWDKIQAEASLKAQHKTIHKLQAQIDFLNEQRATWERDSSSFKEHGVSAHFVAQLQESRAETARAREEAALAAQNLRDLQAHSEALAAKLHKAQAEKQGVDERVHQGVQEAERAARAQIAQLQQAHEALQAQLSSEEQAHLDAQSVVTSLRHELHLLQHSASTKVSQLTSQTTLMTHHADLISKLNSQVSELRSACRTLESQRAKIESEWRLSQQELLQSQSALESLREQATARGLGLQDKGQEVVELREALDQAREEQHGLETQVLQRDQRIQALHAEAQAAQAEKQDMLQSISRADQALLTVQAEVQALHQDRQAKEQDYANLYEDYTQQLAQLQDIKQSTFPSLQAQLTALRTDKERLQAALDDMQNNTVGDLSQREQSLKAEVARLASSHRELLQRLDQEQQSSSELQGQVTTLQADLSALASASSSKASQISSSQALVQHHTDLISRLNMQVTDLKAACRSVEAQRSKLEAEWTRAREEAQSARHELQLQMELHASQSVLLQQRLQEVADLRSQLSDLDMVRSNLQQQLAQQQERLEQAAQEREQRSQAEMRWNSTLDENGSQIAALQDALRSRELELSQVSAQVSGLLRSSSKLSEDSALKASDLKAVLADLENVLKENQMLTGELAALRTTAENANLDAERHVARAEHAENLFRDKEGECLDLLSNYRSVCGELERLKITGGELDAERAASRQALKASQEAQYALEASLAAAQAELRKRMVDIQAGEQTAQQLSRALEAQKKAMDSLHAEKSALIAAHQGAQAVAGGLEQSRVEGLRALGEQKAALAAAQRDHDSLAMDNRHLQDMLQQAREHAAKLETIIAQQRNQAAQAANSTAAQNNDKNARIDKMQQELQHAKIAAEAMQDQIQSLNQYREKQNAEINR